MLVEELSELFGACEESQYEFGCSGRESQEEAEGGGPFEVMLTVLFRSDDISTE